MEYVVGQILNAKELVQFANWKATHTDSKLFAKSLGDHKYEVKEVVVPEPTKEEQEQARASAYASEIDPLHARKFRKSILGEWTEEDEAEYVAKVKELSAEIVGRYPYPVEKGE